MQEYDPIFVVDDDEVLRGQIVSYLLSHGYTATGFPDVSSAESALKAQNCSLLLLDIMLPGEDGLSFCRRLRSRSAVPIIFLSALGELTDRVVGLELGADDYLVKPFSSRELLAPASVRCSAGWTHCPLPHSPQTCESLPFFRMDDGAANPPAD